ncbi:MAG: alpha/beta fold hydrolase [Candidatus Heimdallarchaeaceae archaeon]
MSKERTKFEEEFPQDMIFIKESAKEYILMSDEQEVFCYYSNKKSNFKETTIVFLQGFGSGIYTWTDLWDELSKEYDLVVIDPRDKETIKLKNRECSVPRIAKDIVETIHYLKIDEKNVFFIGSSVGASYIAHCISQGWIKPKGCLFTGPAQKPRTPKFLINLSFLLPSSILDKAGKYIGRLWLKNKVADGFQRKVFYNRIDKIDVKRWKQCRKIQSWDATEDFRAIQCPVYIVITSGDKYHKLDASNKVAELIHDSKIIDVPSYDYYHIKPGMEEFTQTIKRIIEKLST